MEPHLNKETIKALKGEVDIDEPVDTSDREAVNKSRKKAARTRTDRLEFIKAAMQHEQGRAWFYDVLEFCRVVATPFSSDPYNTAFKCGMQNVGLKILADIQDASPDEYMLMVKEARTKK